MKITDETIETLQKQLAELEPGRQHGRKGIVLADSEAEKRRLYNNLASRLYRAKKRAMMKENSIRVSIAPINMDNYGITDRDERRYRNCFVYINIQPTMEYVKLMTGLEDYQIDELAKRTGLYPDKTSIIY